MKKIIQVVLLFVIVLFSASCMAEKTYFDLRLEFEEHLNETKQNYIEKINNFNYISEAVFQSVVKIELDFKHGTGVVFQFDDNYYYILTNAHIIYAENEDVSITVIDVFDEHYQGEIVDYSLEHDLAIIKINKNNELKSATFTKSNSFKNTEVMIIGYHGVQKNAITYGEVLLYDNVDLKNNTNIKIEFPSMISSNPIKSGSSGSIVINNEGFLVALLYAGSFNNSSDVAKYAFSIPVEIIIDYLLANDFTPIYKGDES